MELRNHYTRLDSNLIGALKQAAKDGIQAAELAGLRSAAEADGALGAGERALLADLEAGSRDGQAVTLELDQADFDPAAGVFDLKLGQGGKARLSTAGKLPEGLAKADERALVEALYVPGETSVREIRQTLDYLAKAGVPASEALEVLNGQYATHPKASSGGSESQTPEVERQNGRDALAALQGYGIIREALQLPQFAQLPAQDRQELEAAASAIKQGKVRFEDKRGIFAPRALYTISHDTISSTHSYPGLNGMLKGFDITSPLHRATMLHELRHAGQDSNPTRYADQNRGQAHTPAYLVEGLYMLDQPLSPLASGSDRKTREYAEAFTDLARLETEQAALAPDYASSDMEVVKRAIARDKELSEQIDAARLRRDTAEAAIVKMAGTDAQQPGGDYTGYQTYQ